MLRKFFPRDKNYVLEEAQLSLRDPLLEYLVDFVKVEYLLKCNPLGLMDEHSLRVTSHQAHHFTHLYEFYISLAGVFRYKYYGDNQLQFVFDGRDDSERYREEWSGTFKRWSQEFCRHESFIRAVLELTVFYPDDYTPQMAGLRLSAFITKSFEVKIDPQKGIIKKSVA